MMKRLRLVKKSVCYGALVMVFLAAQMPMTAQALTSEQRRLFNSGIYYYNVDDSSCVPTVAGNTQTAEARVNLNQVADKYQLQSAMVKQVGGAVIDSFNATATPASPASTLKVIVADAILRANPELNKNVTVLSKHLYYGPGTGEGTVDDPRAGAEVSLIRAIEITLMYSSNTYANVLIDAAGGLEGATAKAKSAGYTSTLVNNYFSNNAIKVNETTVTDLTNALEHIYTAAGEGYLAAQKALRNSTNTFGISSEANKWGGNSKATGNSAVISAGSSKYIVTAYIDKPYSRPNTAPASTIKDATNEIVAQLGSGTGGGTQTARTVCPPTCTSEPGETLPANVPQPHSALFTKAAAAHKVNPQFLAAIFLTENGNVWKAFDSDWASSREGASGPFQFMPATWDAYQQDGDNDGRKDINNMADAAFAAARMLSVYTDTSTPLGEIETPFKPKTMLLAAANYNWGEGNVQQKTNPSSPITAGPVETQNYQKNIHSLITSGFTKSGHANYKDPTGASSGGDSATTAVCSGTSSSVVQTALSLAWPGPHTPRNQPKPEYLEALKKYNLAGYNAPSRGADCGVFVATVMRASGADPDFPLSGTSIQAKYVRDNPGKYDVVDRVNSTNELQAGDILIVNSGSGSGANGHIYIYTDKQGEYNQASASYNDDNPIDGRMPSLGNADLNDWRGYYMRARLK